MVSVWRSEDSLGCQSSGIFWYPKASFCRSGQPAQKLPGTSLSVSSAAEIQASATCLAFYMGYEIHTRILMLMRQAPNGMRQLSTFAMHFFDASRRRVIKEQKELIPQKKLEVREIPLRVQATKGQTHGFKLLAPPAVVCLQGSAAITHYT